MIRTRFAPSPTGFLHLGSLRTALFNYLFAKHHKGSLILRVEDTDAQRNVPDAERDLESTLHWAGIHPDESPSVGGPYGPYRQSERFATYNEHVRKLVREDKAYKCFASKDEVARLQEAARRTGQKVNYDQLFTRAQRDDLSSRGASHVIRLRVPVDGTTAYDDVIYGRMEFSNGEIEDQVLMRSDGRPTYHLANVVDDRAMNISHVIRGEEWLQSTAKHVLLYEAFGWVPPIFAHLPLLLNKGGGKLSKRNRDVFANDFRRQGVMSSALVNYVALLGWSPPSTEQRIFTMNQLVDTFSLEDVNRNKPTVDVGQIAWFNKEHLKMAYESPLGRASVIRDMQGLVTKTFSPVSERMISSEYLHQVLEVLIDRISYLPDVLRLGSCFWVEPKSTGEQFRVVSADYRLILEKSAEKLDACDFVAHNVISLLRNVARDVGVQSKTVLRLIRLAVTGQEVGGQLGLTLEVLGKETVLRRLHAAGEI